MHRRSREIREWSQLLRWRWWRTRRSSALTVTLRFRSQAPGSADLPSPRYRSPAAVRRKTMIHTSASLCTMSKTWKRRIKKVSFLWQITGYWGELSTATEWRLTAVQGQRLRSDMTTFIWFIEPTAVQNCIKIWPVLWNLLAIFS